MASFKVYNDDPGAASSYYYVADVNNAIWSTYTTPSAASGNRGPGGAYNKLVLTRIDFDVAGYDGTASVDFCIWSPARTTAGSWSAVYHSGNKSISTVVGATSSVPTYAVTGIASEISGNTSYAFGVHNESDGGMTVQRIATSGRTVYIDTSHGSYNADVDINDSRGGYAVKAMYSYITLTSAPTLVSTGVVGGRKQVTVTWSAPASTGDSAVSKYLVYYKKSTDSTWTEIDTGSTALSRTITGLENNTTYNVRVAAWNGASDVIDVSSEYSATYSATTLPGGPQVRSGLTTWAPSELFVCTSNGSWPSSANAEMFVCTGTSPTVWTPIA